MGRDKALLELEGRPLVAWGLDSLRPVCASVAIAGGTPELARYGTVIADVAPGSGPLSGIVAGLEQSGCEWNLFLAVDVPFVPALVWERLLGRAAESDAVVVMARVGGKRQPLCAAYARRAAGALRAELEARRLKVVEAVAAAGEVDYVDFEEPGWFQNFNTPEEFVRAAGEGPVGESMIRKL